MQSRSRRRGHPGVVPGEIQMRVNIRLSDRLQQMAREIGDGNMSEGIRIALESAHKKRQRY